MPGVRILEESTEPSLSIQNHEAYKTPFCTNSASMKIIKIINRPKISLETVICRSGVQSTALRNNFPVIL